MHRTSIALNAPASGVHALGWMLVRRSIITAGLILTAMISATAAYSTAAPPDSQGAAAVPADSVDWKQPVDLRMVDAPLKDVVHQLGAVSKLRMSAAPDLQERKAIVILHQRPLLEAMNKIASVFGSRWVRVLDHKQIRYEMRRLDTVQKWRSYYNASHSRSEAYAYGRLASAIRKQIDRQLADAEAAAKTYRPESIKMPDGSVMAAGPGPPEPDLCSFLQSQEPASLDALAQFQAHFWPIDPVEGVPNISADGWGDTPPVVTPFEALPAAQQQQLLAILKRQPRMQDLETRLPDLSIGLIGDGNTIGIRWMTPEDTAPRFTRAIVCYTPQVAKLPEAFQSAFARLMKGRPMPPEALLGAALEDDGTPKVPVEVCQELSGREALVGRVQYREFMEELADQLKVDVIGDYVTDSGRMNVARAPVKELLQDASRRFHIVFRQDGSYLLARHWTWPQDERTEINWPLPENWTRLKQTGRDLTVDDLADMATCTDEQLVALRSYRDGKVRLTFDIDAVRRHHARDVLLMYRRLPESVKMQITADTGTTAASLPLPFMQQLSWWEFLPWQNQRADTRVTLQANKLAPMVNPPSICTLLLTLDPKPGSPQRIWQFLGGIQKQ